MSNEQTRLMIVVAVLFLPSILLYVRSFIIAFIDAWIHRKEYHTETIGDLMSEISHLMDDDILISWELPFIVPFFSILTLIIITVLDIGHLMCYIFDKTIYRLLIKSECKLIWKYAIKIPIEYCVVKPWMKICQKFEHIKEKIYSIHI